MELVYEATWLLQLNQNGVDTLTEYGRKHFAIWRTVPLEFSSVLQRNVRMGC